MGTHGVLEEVEGKAVEIKTTFGLDYLSGASTTRDKVKKFIVDGGMRVLERELKRAYEKEEDPVIKEKIKQAVRNMAV